MAKRKEYEGREGRGRKAGCMSRAAMVTVIHVVDTAPPPIIPRSACLSRRPPCVPGRVTVQSATTKEEARHCYRKCRRPKAVSTPPALPPPPESLQLLLHHHCNYRFNLWAFSPPSPPLRPGSAHRTGLNFLSLFFCHLEMFMFICQRARQQSTPALRTYHWFRTK